MKNAALYGLFYVLIFATLLMVLLDKREMWFLCCIAAGALALVFRQRRFVYIFLFPSTLWAWEAAVRLTRFADGQMAMHPPTMVVVGFIGLSCVGIALSFVSLAACLVLPYKAIFSIEK